MVLFTYFKKKYFREPKHEKNRPETSRRHRPHHSRLARENTEHQNMVQFCFVTSKKIFITR
jgi:hypothetical protein